MRLRLGMDNDEVGPRLCERSDIAARGVDHHVHIKKKPALAAQSSNNRLTKGDIWNEGSVHDIKMEPPHASLFQFSEDLAQAGKIRRKE